MKNKDQQAQEYAVHTSIPKAWCPVLCLAIQETSTNPNINTNVQEKQRKYPDIHIA